MTAILNSKIKLLQMKIFDLKKKNNNNNNTKTKNNVKNKKIFIFNFSSVKHMIIQRNQQKL